MSIESWPGAIAVVLAVISFYGTTYLVIALNVGWRFGYWLASACFGALMVLLSLFWVLNIQTDQAVGPQGAVPKWVPVAAGEEIQSVEYNGESITAPSSYPGGDWTEPEEGDPNVDSFGTAIGTCLTSTDENLSDMCKEAQELMPAETEIPVLEGAAVAVLPKLSEVRFTEDGGKLAQAIVRPITTDPRVSEDPGGELLAPEFQVVAILDEGSIGLPSYMSLLVFLVYAAFHLWGLHRAERRKLSPAVT